MPRIEKHILRFFAAFYSIFPKENLNKKGLVSQDIKIAPYPFHTLSVLMSTIQQKTTLELPNQKTAILITRTDISWRFRIDRKIMFHVSINYLNVLVSCLKHETEIV